MTLARLGPLRLWLARADKEWGYAVEYGESSQVLDISQVPEDVVPQQLNWINTLFDSAPREYLLRPTVPDRPVVVKPKYPVIIPQGQSGRFYVLLPIFIKAILIDKEKEIDLGTVASRKLSDTWFGITTEGEFCYSLPYPAELDLQLVRPRPHHILCPIVIKNHSHEALKFEKLCFRPQYLGLYCGDTHVWSSLVQVVHEGSFKGVAVNYTTQAPEGEDNLLLLAAPLRREERGLSRLTFGSGFKRDVIFGK